MFIALVAGEAAGDVLEWQFRQDRDAVEAFLSMGFNGIPEVLKVLGGEVLVDGLDLLQDGDVGGAVLEPFRQRVDPGLDAVDVERGDFHGGR